MTRISIIGFSSRLQKGQAAQLSSRIKALKEVIPDAEFTVFVSHPEVNIGRNDVKVLLSPLKLSTPTKVLQSTLLYSRSVLWYLLHRWLKIDFSMLTNEPRLKEIRNADVVIDIGGDTLTEDYGRISLASSIILHSLPILLQKPLVIYAETLGPYSKIDSKLAIKFLLNQASLITVREKASYQEIKRLGIRTPIHLTADSAFLLESVGFDEMEKILIKEGIGNRVCPLIGVSVSRIISCYGFLNVKHSDEKYTQYIEIMAKVVDYLVENMQAKIVFVPNVIEPWARNDDRIVAEDIYQLVKMKDGVKLIKEDYTAEETKGIIGQCQLFIGARMHAVIAATSMCVPTVAISYSRKTDEIIGKMLNQERYILRIKELSYESLTAIAQDAWNNQQEIKKSLAPRISEMQERCRLNAVLVKNLLDSLH